MLQTGLLFLLHSKVIIITTIIPITVGIVTWKKDQLPLWKKIFKFWQVFTVLLDDCFILIISLWILEIAPKIIKVYSQLYKYFYNNLMFTFYNLGWYVIENAYRQNMVVLLNSLLSILLLVFDQLIPI